MGTHLRVLSKLKSYSMYISMTGFVRFSKIIALLFESRFIIRRVNDATVGNVFKPQCGCPDPPTLTRDWLPTAASTWLRMLLITCGGSGEGSQIKPLIHNALFGFQFQSPHVSDPSSQVNSVNSSVAVRFLSLFPRSRMAYNGVFPNAVCSSVQFTTQRTIPIATRVWSERLGQTHKHYRAFTFSFIL